ncbi:hypothetical protein ACFQ1R_11025 [Mariniflexile jejuense]|uniref:S9 family peptidase n=1 Tax=Mariniflexile jejuense TaxID=1173582 RepID=A0ABW3JK17_9FLAO
MKTLFFSVCFFICIKVSAQSGVYVLDYTQNADGTKIKWTLSLNQDGTFLYHFLRDLSAVSKANTEENFYGKGIWTVDKNLIFLTTNKETDLDEKYTMDFTNSKARYTTKLPRDTSNKVVKTSLRFYESDIFHIKGLELFKE